MSKRKDVENYIYSYLSKITGNENNSNLYKTMFGKMDDVEFTKYINDLESGKTILSIIAPNFDDTSKISVENNLKIAEELGHKFFQKLWIEGDDKTPTYLTPVEYLVIDLPVKRASQLLAKKISVPDHTRVVDSMTGQPTGDSKGARMSYPELQLCVAMGLDNSMTELMKYRGGDKGGLVALNSMLSKYGSANMKTLSKYATGVVSTNTLRTFLTCAHLRNNL